MTAQDQDKYLIMFDGVCNLCNGYVNFAIDRDPKDKFRFTAFQSNAGKQLRVKYHIADEMASVVLIRNEKVFYKSRAILEILSAMPMPYNWLYIFILVPTIIRDAVYGFIARNRYHWFGKREVCRMPTPKLRNKFMD